MHSERLADQLRAVALLETAGLSEALRYANGHLSIIRRFGRFPHRNAILGRTSIPEERAFLAQHDHHYGQRTEEARDRVAPPDRDLPDPGAAQALGRRKRASGKVARRGEPPLRQERSRPKV
jgi:Bacterial protein of unknown function (DUF924)